jgi:prepilin-type N-terminal cleavage/methylation domain-containing protein
MKKRGFTLIEALVAISIVALSIGGPLYAASRALVASQIARDKLIATYLAQEGVEQVRFKRDTFYLQAYPPADRSWWDTNFITYVSNCDGLATPARWCAVEPTTHALIGPYTAAAPPAALLINSANGQYFQIGSVGPGVIASPFVRTVQVKQIGGSDNDEEITAKVQWTFHGTPYSVVVTDHLTPWQ